MANEKLEWEVLGDSGLGKGAFSGYLSTYRTAIPGGWLVMAETDNHDTGLTFVADPEHKWDGCSVKL